MATLPLPPGVRQAILDRETLSAFSLGPRAYLVTDTRIGRGYLTVRFDGNGVGTCEQCVGRCGHVAEAERQRTERELPRERRDFGAWWSPRPRGVFDTLDDADLDLPA